MRSDESRVRSHSGSVEYWPAAVKVGLLAEAAVSSRRASLNLSVHRSPSPMRLRSAHILLTILDAKMPLSTNAEQQCTRINITLISCI